MGIRKVLAQRRCEPQRREFGVSGRLEGKRIVVTGAANGIGASVARRFTEEGARVSAIDLNASQLEAIPAASRHQLDISDAAAVDRVAREVGQIDVLFNSAGYVAVGNIFQTSDEDWDKSFSVNVRGTHLMMRAFLPGMLDQGHGVITNVASIGGAISAVADRYVYGATKAAVIGLTKDLASDFVDRNIRANCICPGTILTASMKARIENVANRDGRAISEVMQEYAGRQAMRRMAGPDEITGLAVYLCSDESSFCTGGCYVIDGGNSM